jgi:hypothetical protein
MFSRKLQTETMRWMAVKVSNASRGEMPHHIMPLEGMPFFAATVPDGGFHGQPESILMAPA